MVVSREGNIEGFFFACFAATDARFKVGQHSAVADDEVHVFAAAAIECDAVQLADEIHGNAVGIFRRLVGFAEGALLAAQGGNHVIHVFVAHFATRQGDADLIQTLDFNFGHDFKNGGVFDRFVGGHAGDELDLRRGDGFVTALLDGFAVGFFNYFTENILADASAVFLFDDGRRNLAGTETVNAHARRDFFETFGDFLIKTRRRHFNR